MENVQWVRIRSWHVLRTFTRAIDGALTVCGRMASASTAIDDRPGNERTCETCLRIAGPK